MLGDALTLSAAQQTDARRRLPGGEKARSLDGMYRVSHTTIAGSGHSGDTHRPLTPTLGLGCACGLSCLGAQRMICWVAELSA